MKKKLSPEAEKQLNNLANRLKTLRKEKESSYEVFAFKNGISRVQYWRYENGQDIKFTTLLRVLKGLDISLEEFFGEGFEDE